jgi:hypothetical protein
MCYILCMSSSVCVVRVQGENSPRWGLGQRPREFFLPREMCHIFGWFFGTWFFADGFLFPVKELGLLTNPGHWVRVLDAAGSYMYIVL